MSLREQELAAKVRAHDPQALAEFLQVVRPQFLAYIERRLGGALRRKIEPDDIFQEASAEAVRSLASIDLTGREPFGWLCQVAERRIVDAHRRFFGAQKRDAAREKPLQAGDGSQKAGLVHLLAQSMTTPSQAFSRNVREARLQAALQDLPDDQREAIRLRYVEGLPSKEIAERLGKTDAAVRVMLSRTLRRLEERLGHA